MNLKISVIIPCYQVEEYVAYVYADLCKQSFTDMEMIFVMMGGVNRVYIEDASSSMWVRYQ